MDSVSKHAKGVSGAASKQARAEGASSIGTYLAGQRKLRGISVEQLAEQTRIPLRSLQRLEAGVFDGEGDGFVRGFVRTVAEALGLDPEDTLARTLVEPSGFDTRAAQARVSLRRLLLVTGFAVAVVGAIAVFDALPLTLVRSGDPGGGSEQIIRRDPVRVLAEAQRAPFGLVGSGSEELCREP